MAYDAPLTRLGAFPGSATKPLCKVAAPRVVVEEHDWTKFDCRERIGAWDALAERAAHPNPFYESWYLLPSLRALDKRHRVTILALEVDGQLAGLMPMRRSRDYYGHPIPHLANWVHSSGFLGQPLVARGFEQQFWRALLDWCDRATKLPPFLHVSHVPATGALHDSLFAVLAEDARPAAVVHREQRAMLSAETSAEDYWNASLSARKREELQRQLGLLQEQGDYRVERLTNYTGIAEWTREFLNLEARGSKGEAGSALGRKHATRQVFQYSIAGAAARGRLERLALRVDGKPIAMLANFLAAPAAFSYKTAIDPDFARFSLDVLLQRENLALLDREDIAWTDSCASQDHPVIDQFWHQRREIQRISIAVGGKVRRAAFHALARAETGAWAGSIR